MLTALSWLAFAGGLGILLSTAASVLGTLVVPHNISSRISRVCESLADLAFRVATCRTRGFVRRDRILVWQAPGTLLLRLAVWIGLLVLGYALMLMPSVSGSVGRALTEAGSSVFTLGYAAPSNASSSAIEYAAAYTGLVVIGLQVGYLPTFYAAFNRRETLVTMLASRAGVPAWGPEILARTRWGVYDVEPGPVLRELFQAWEGWCAEVAESHTTYLALQRLNRQH